MSKLFDDASLAMIPSAYKDGKLYSIRPTDGSGDFTFSRGSNLAATRVDVNGLIEKGRENTTTYSQDATQWSSQKAAQISTTETDPFGGNNAAEYEVSSITGASYFYRTTSPSWSSGQVVTGSVYIKDVDQRYVQLTFGTAAFGGSQYQNFDLQTGTKGTSLGMIDSTITSIGNGWYRLTITAQTISSGASGVVPCFVPSASAVRLQTPSIVGQSIQAFGFQTELGLVATDYIETGASTAQAGILEDMPRLDYSGGASCPSLKLEPQRTNAIADSEYFGTWNSVSYPVTITSNSATSPEGTLNATLITPTSGSNRHAIRELNVTAVSGTTYTLSAFLKKAGSRYVVLGDSGDSLWRLVTADLDNGTITDETNATGTIEPYANDWYRITCTFTITNSVTIQTFLGASPVDTNTSAPTFDDTSLTTYAYGAQLEIGASYPTSYIPTYGSSVTRSYDDCDLLDLVSKDIITDATEWTIMFEVDGFSDEYTIGDGQWFAGQNSTLDVYMHSHNTTDKYGRFYWRKDGKYLSTTNGKKIIARLSNGIGTNFADGVKLASGSITGDYSGIGFNKTNNPVAAGYVKQILVFPTALTDSECIALTTL